MDRKSFEVIRHMKKITSSKCYVYWLVIFWLCLRYI